MNKNIVAANIKKYRKAKKITQTELGNLLGKSLSTVQKYESGEIEVALDILMSISKILDVDMYKILYSENSESYKDFKRDEELSGYFDESHRKIENILNSNKNIYNFNLKDILNLLEILNLDFVYDDKKDVVYVSENCPNPTKIVVSNINQFLIMIKNIYSIRDNFWDISQQTTLTYDQILDSLLKK